MDEASAHETRKLARWRRFMTVGLFLRLMIALLVSWLIIMAFFATSAMSN